ncbi:carboxypeptidase regulatory-like domain-containing protein [Actinokineospora iranica]|uniref:alpha-amylase n=1 Tax=Actinokineospora iranica TaxID=1271860 RepID=A0A1G6NHW5_9PSEU|nr:carboxypeptidase regulatory-like domain-containing protein [Actinokineospora iranica]SDC66926.1 Serine protease, subtilisin family [Actinokineospora iranica]
MRPHLPHPHRRAARQTWLALVAAVLGLLTTLTVPAAAAPPAGDPNAKIDVSVARTLDTKGSGDFWVLFGEQADLSGPSRLTDWAARGQAVLDALRATADRSQAAVRADLDAAKVDYEPYFIANALRVHNGTEELAQALAARGEVAALLAPQTYQLPTPAPGKEEAEVDAVEWGLAAIDADDVWSGFGVRGEGVVVGNIDSGVQFDHPALVGKYRGNAGGGTFDHAYNWFDPSRVCPTAAPCDNNGHGTHTMGTMVGDDGAANQIGVAPGARWIAAKGCESNSCSDTALMAAGQWMLAPTDAAGANPRPDLRPHVVNNSWGSSNGSVVDPWYRATVTAWRAAGMFPSFSTGNSGPGCNSAGSPGDNAEAYATGAFDVNGAIASFSSRGPGENGDVKPNLAAPGVNIRSSVPGGAYAPNNGTSMATPHTSGTVALMWSAAPSLVGDVARTAELLDLSAVDVDNLTCGGTVADNHVFGEGKLNALAAVEQSPRGPVGTLNGTVTDVVLGVPLAGARVTITGPNNRTTTTGLEGTFATTLPVGDYSVAVAAFGYGGATTSATVTENTTVTRDLALRAVPRHTVTGVVRDSGGAAIPNATVQVVGTPVPPARTGADGAYTIPGVPLGAYRITASAGGCTDPQTVDLTVDADKTLGFTLPTRRDSFGHHCAVETSSYVEGDTPVTLTGDDAATGITLPFGFFFYGRTYHSAFVTTNGHINFLARSTAFTNVALPALNAPNAAIYPFWDDLFLDANSRVYTKTTGVAPNREFVVEWRDATFYQATSTRVDFEAVLSENGEISLRYRGLDPAVPRETGVSATVGIENHTGTVGLQYSLNSPVLSDADSVRFKLPPSGLVAGVVTDANDGLPVEDATVRALRGDTEIAQATTGPDGAYRLRLLAGDYTIEVAKENYVDASKTVTVTQDLSENVALKTPRAELNTTTLTFLGQPGQLRTSTVALASTSDLALTYQLTDNAPWLWAVPGSSTLKPGQRQNITVRVDPVGLLPGVHEAAVTLTTNAGRTPTLTIPVRLVVPAYRTGVNAGGGGFTDRDADGWSTDQAWAPGGFGYLSGGPVVTAKKEITGTDDDVLYQSQRESAGGYRFDALPGGTYQVELSFAELRAGLVPGRRVFDVSLNGAKVLPNHDIAARVGTMAADRREFWVTVPEGGSIAVELAALRGKLPPVLNAVRVTHRPDRTE